MGYACLLLIFAIKPMNRVSVQAVYADIESSKEFVWWI